MNGRRTFRIGIAGLGGAATQMLPTLVHHPRIRISGAADLRSEACERFIAEFDAPAFPSVEALCAQKEIDAVYVATPNNRHVEHAAIAAQCGKHIILEKPMALTLEECDTIISAVAKNGVHLVVGHTHAFDAPIRKIREIVASGELGSVAMINSWNYTDYLYRPRWPDELRSEVGGGIFYNQVTHQVDIVRLIGGGLVRTVRSRAWMFDEDRPIEGSHLTFLDFEGGGAASLAYSGYDNFDSDEFHFWIGEAGEEKLSHKHGATRGRFRDRSAGSEAEAALKAKLAYGGETAFAWGGTVDKEHHPHFGMLIVTCALGDLRPAADGVLIYGQKGLVTVPVDPIRAFPDKFSVVDELIQAVECDVPSIHDGRWGKATLEVCLAIVQSSRERREVTLSHQIAV